MGLAGCSSVPGLDTDPGCVSDRIVVSPAHAHGTSDIELRARATSKGRPVRGLTIDFFLYAHGTTSVASATAVTDGTGVARGRLASQYTDQAALHDKAMQATRFTAKYEQALVASARSHAYCKATGSAPVTFG